jgi:hypothetical protein
VPTTPRVSIQPLRNGKNCQRSFDSISTYFIWLTLSIRLLRRKAISFFSILHIKASPRVTLPAMLLLFVRLFKTGIKWLFASHLQRILVSMANALVLSTL